MTPRITALVISITVSVILLLFMHFTIPKESYLANLFLDRNGMTYPFSVQNVMWVFFCIGLGEIGVRVYDVYKSRKHLRNSYLPEDNETILLVGDLPEIYQNVVGYVNEDKDAFLPRLIQRVVLQFQTSRSVDQANVLLNSSLELLSHELELRYNMLRYIAWLLPTLGFIGTVIGISISLSYAAGYGPDDGGLLPALVMKLGVAFHTTLLGLLMSGVLVFLLSVVQGEEEGELNRAGGYCLDNLINRLYEPVHSTSHHNTIES